MSHRHHPNQSQKTPFSDAELPFCIQRPRGWGLGVGVGQHSTIFLDNEPFLIWKMGPKKLIMGNIAKLLKKIVANHETKMGNHLAENSEIIKICACTFCPTPE